MVLVPEVCTWACASSDQSTLETYQTKGHSTQPHWPMGCEFEQACAHLPPGPEMSRNASQHVTCPQKRDSLHTHQDDACINKIGEERTNKSLQNQIRSAMAERGYSNLQQGISMTLHYPTWWHMHIRTWRAASPKQKPFLLESLKLEPKTPTHKIQLWRFMEHVDLFSCTSSQVNECILYNTTLQGLIGTMQFCIGFLEDRNPQLVPLATCCKSWLTSALTRNPIIHNYWNPLSLQAPCV